MKQIQVTVPEENSEEVSDILNNYRSDFYSVKGEKDGKTVSIFYATVNSSDIDGISSEPKSIKELKLGELIIRVLDESSLIEKGQKTRSSSTMLSQEEVYSKAQDAASFNKAQWALLGLSSAVAAYGLLLDNIAVVIGAMMLAPVLAPLVASAISLTVGDKTLLIKSIKTSLVALPVSITVATLAILPFDITMNSSLNLIVSAGVPNMLLSLFVGAAASLAFVTGMRDQIAGVAVAIALVPPLAATGLGIMTGDLLFTSRAMSIATVNLLAVLVSGSVSLKLLGFSPSTYYKKKSAEQMKFIFPISILVMLAAMAFLLLRPI